MSGFFKNIFRQAAPQSEAERALQAWGIKYTKQSNGMIVVKGSIDISGKGLTQLPDLTKVVVEGSFWCCHNRLTSLQGVPASIGRDFRCNNNQLTSLQGAPTSIGRDFWCHDNQLTSLQGSPSSVGGNFWCNNNNLISLQGAPASTGGNFECRYNALKDLEGAPRTFKKLYSDFDEFYTWKEVPADLRFSPETRQKKREQRERKKQERRERQENKKKEYEDWLKAGLPLRHDIKITPPLQLKKKLPPQEPQP